MSSTTTRKYPKLDILVDTPACRRENCASEKCKAGGQCVADCSEADCHRCGKAGHVNNEASLECSSSSESEHTSDERPQCNTNTKYAKEQEIQQLHHKLEIYREHLHMIREERDVYKRAWKKARGGLMDGPAVPVRPSISFLACVNENNKWFCLGNNEQLVEDQQKS